MEKQEEIKLLILLENIPLKCKYYKYDECDRTIEYHYPNCLGDIKDCNLKKEELKNIKEE